MINSLCIRAIMLFLVLALGMSFLYWGMFVLNSHGLLPFDPSSDIWGAVRGYGPTLAAIVTAAFIYGRDGINELWARVKKWRIPLWLFALAICGPMLGNLILLFLVHLSGVDLVLNSEIAPIPKIFLIFFFFAIVDGPVGEEIGWRGFLLPRLLEKFGALPASAFIGFVWFAWHLPLYIATDRFDIDLAFLFGYLLNNVAFSVLHTWFFLRSGGSALLAIIFHTAGNYFVFLSVSLFPIIEKSSATQPLYVLVLVVAAIFAGFSLWRGETYKVKVPNID